MNLCKFKRFVLIFAFEMRFEEWEMKRRGGEDECDWK